MKASYIILFLFFTSSITIWAQAQEKVNPKGKWFFGIEAGKNETISTASNSFQAGITGEYYFHKNWSFTGRIKYFKTGISDKDSKLNFSGKVISFPLNIKLEFKIIGNFSGNLSLGASINKEIKSYYEYYSQNTFANLSTIYQTFNTGVGFSYFMTKKIGIYFNLEIYTLGNKIHRSTNKVWMYSSIPQNKHHNFGIKFNL